MFNLIDFTKFSFNGEPYVTFSPKGYINLSTSARRLIGDRVDILINVPGKQIAFTAGDTYTANRKNGRVGNTQVARNFGLVGRGRIRFKIIEQQGKVYLYFDIPNPK